MARRNAPRDHPRTARLNRLIQQIVAEELERIDDERLDLVSVTAVDVDGDVSRAAVYYDHGRGDEAEEEIQEAFAELRPRLQAAVNRQTHLRRTPQLRFAYDGVLGSALRIDTVLRDLADEPPVPPVDEG